MLVVMTDIFEMVKLLKWILKINSNQKGLITEIEIKLRLVQENSQVRAPGLAGTLRALFFSTLPSFLLQPPTNPAKVLGLKNCLVYYNSNTISEFPRQFASGCIIFQKVLIILRYWFGVPFPLNLASRKFHPVV